MTFLADCASGSNASKIRRGSGVIHMALSDCPEYKKEYENLQHLRQAVANYRENRNRDYGKVKARHLASAAQMKVNEAQELISVHSKICQFCKANSEPTK